jgi:hypothetical protein
MNRSSKPKQLTDLSVLAQPKTPDPLLSEISVDKLIDDCLLVLHREIKNLLKLSVPGKLDANDARDLRDHLKLLFDLKERENAMLKGLTDDELKTLASTERPNEGQQD